MKYALYFLPFIFFILGYTALSWLTHVNTVAVPSLIGMPLGAAITKLSELQLNVRIVGSQEEAGLPEGTVLSHVPAAGSGMKSHQRVFMIISKKPEELKAPLFVGIPLEQAESVAQKQGIRLKKFFVASVLHSKNNVIAQVPSAGQSVPDKMVILYCSSGDESLVLIPDFRGLPVSVVESFCSRNEVRLEIVYAHPPDARYGHDDCVVKHQRPLAGSLMKIDKKTTFQIRIEKY